MTFIKSLFNKKEDPISTYEDFWKWFQQNEKTFHKVVAEGENIEKDFFNVIEPKLNSIKEGFWYLAGMADDDTAELVLTADGVVKNIVFVEELVNAAPKMENWKITALKQPSENNNYGINMAGYNFDENTMHFYPIEHPYMPDEIDIVITHKDLNSENRDVIINGVYIAIDNNLGEINSITTIDNLNVINTKDAEKELIPIEKLKNFLIWREKEFIEKYSGVRYNTASDSHSSLEATLENGMPLFAVINTDLINWDNKVSHPWILKIEVKYDGKNNNGLPSEVDYKELSDFENRILEQLIDSNGYLYVARETADSIREVYFACVEFRKPAKVMYELEKEYKGQLDICFEIYKDKYWQTFNRFNVSEFD